MCCPGSSSCGSPAPPNRGVPELRAPPDSLLPKSWARARGVSRKLGFASSSSSDPCLTSDLPFSSLALSSPFYKMRLMNEGSVNAPSSSLVAPQGQAWWGMETLGAQVFLQHRGL